MSVRLMLSNLSRNLLRAIRERDALATGDSEELLNEATRHKVSTQYPTYIQYQSDPLFLPNKSWKSKSPPYFLLGLLEIKTFQGW